MFACLSPPRARPAWSHRAHSCAAHPINRDQGVVAHNPLGKIPTLITDDGVDLYDSRVICEYLNGQGDGHLTRDGGERLRSSVEQALADGIMDAAVLARYETVARPEALRWNDWTAGQLEKVSSGLDVLESRAGAFGTRVDLGTIAIGCALGYLDFRYASLGWRDKHPNAAGWFAKFAARESMIATRPDAA